MMDTEERRWYLGVDWGSAEHWARLADEAGRELGKRRFGHSGEGLKQLSEWALKLSGGRAEQVWVAIETPRGPVVESLMERGFRLFSINPRQADRFRDRFSPSGAKDDSRDTEVLSDALRTDPRAFRELRPGSALIVELREWLGMHRELTGEHVRLRNQVRAQLWRYYPQALELAKDDLGADWFLELWAMAPRPELARRLRKDSVQRLLKRHRIRRLDAEAAITALRAEPISVAAGTAEAAQAHIRLLAKRLGLLNRQLHETDAAIDQLSRRFEAEEEAEPGQPQAQRDGTILRSLPGLGSLGLATLRTEAHELLQRRDYHALRCLCGVAPVTRGSGKTKHVSRRRAANPRLVDALYHWARVAAQRDRVCRAKYTAMRGRGHSHARALRAIGDRMLRIGCSMLKTQTRYDPALSRDTRRAP